MSVDSDPAKEISLDNTPAKWVPGTQGIDKKIFIIAMILGLLTGASILLLIYHANRALQLRIEAAEFWSDYQVKIVKATNEQDPNLKQQYTEEQDVLSRNAQHLREMSGSAKHAAKFSAWAAALLLLGTALAVLALLAKSNYVGYVGLLLGIIGVGLGIRPFF